MTKYSKKLGHRVGRKSYLQKAQEFEREIRAGKYGKKRQKKALKTYRKSGKGHWVYSRYRR